MNDSYAGDYHWEWVERATKQEMSQLGKTVANVLGYVGRGIYNCPISRSRVDWTSEYSVAVVWSGNGMANWDFPQLSLLVIECHRQMLRVEISAATVGRLRLLFHQRESRTGSTSKRLPTIEDMIRYRDRGWGRGGRGMCSNLNEQLTAVDVLRLVGNRAQWQREEGESDLRVTLALVNGIESMLTGGKTRAEIIARYQEDWRRNADD